jgi:hypothetical protein
MRTFGLIAMTAFSLGGCSPSKELNERSSRELLQERARESSYIMSLSEVTQLMNRTPTDYTQATSGLGMILRQLLERKFVQQQSDVATFPRVSGRFTMAATNVHDWERRGEFSLEPVPGSNYLSGNFDLTMEGLHSSGDVRGTVSPDGKIIISPRRYNWTIELQYVEEGASGYLILVSTNPLARGISSRFTGPASHQTFDLRFYTYSFSSELQKQITQVIPGQNGLDWGNPVRNPVLIGGKIIIGDVSRLQLGDVPTIATASFTWTARLNEIGRILAQSETQSGTGWGTFRQKPDGSWLVERWCIKCS